MQQLLLPFALNSTVVKTQNLESVFPSSPLCVRFVVLPSRWALFNFYDSSHSWKQRKIDIQGDYGNVFLTQKMTQFLWPVYSGEEQQGHLVTTFSKQERNE